MEEKKVMKRNRVFLLSLLLFPALSQAEEEEARSFQDVTLAVLGGQVKDFGSAYAQAVVEQIAAESGLEVAEVRAQLKGLLAELEGHRKGKTEVWNSFGFYRTEFYQPPIGTNSRFYLYKLRRQVEARI